MGCAGSSSQAENRLSANPWLDLIRSIAIALVLLRHGQRAIAPFTAEPPSWLHALLMNGWVGVDLFLVLSGYLIGTQLVRAGAGTKPLVYSHYLKLRALRILPAYLAVMILILASMFPLYMIDRDRMLIGRIFYHLMFMQDYLPSDINVVFWSLGVEAKFYLIAPLVIGVLASCPSKSGVILLIAASFMLSPMLRTTELLIDGAPASYEVFFPRFRSPFHASLEPLVVGVALAFAQHAGSLRPSPVAGSGFLAAATGALLAWLATHELLAQTGAFEVILQPTLIACLCGVMTLGAIRLAAVPMPAAAPIRLLSRLSYSLYLVHFPLLPLAVAAARSTGYAAPVFWACYLTTSFACAGLLYGCVERPFLRLRERLVQKRASAGPKQVDGQPGVLMPARELP